MDISGVSDSNPLGGSGSNSALWAELQKAIAAFEKDPSNGNLLEKVLNLDTEMQESNSCTPQQLAALTQIYAGAASANQWAKAGPKYESQVEAMLAYVDAGMRMMTPNIAG